MNTAIRSATAQLHTTNLQESIDFYADVLAYAQDSDAT